MAITKSDRVQDGIERLINPILVFTNLHRKKESNQIVRLNWLQVNVLNDEGFLVGRKWITPVSAAVKVEIQYEYRVTGYGKRKKVFECDSFELCWRRSGRPVVVLDGALPVVREV